MYLWIKLTIGTHEEISHPHFINFLFSRSSELTFSTFFSLLTCFSKKKNGTNYLTTYESQNLYTINHGQQQQQQQQQQQHYDTVAQMDTH
jgi:hypothetical protein